MRKKTRDNFILAYYQQIKSGAVIVGKWVELLFERIISDIESKEIIFDQKKANDAIEWIENHCFHTEGFLAPNNLKLELWQKALVSCLFGLCDPKTKKRQFRECVLIIARKNGKSLLASAIAKYVFEQCGGFGTRVYCLAPKLEQAEIIYNNIWQMVQLDPEWQEIKRQVEESAVGHNKRELDDSIIAKHRQTDLCIGATNSTVKKIAFNARKSDGFNPSLAVCDEIASWQGDAGLKQYEVMKSGMGAREMGDAPGILLSCSTAGYVNDSIYDELLKRSTAYLTGASKEKRLLPFLYMIDDIDKWNDINELRKSNPNLGVSVSVDFLLEEISIAEGSISKRSEFITKYCNLKQNSSQAWLSFDDVDKCFGEELSISDFSGCYCVAGLDLSQTTDLTSACVVVEKNGKLNVFSHFWMPESRLQDAIAEDGVPYNIFLQQGWLSLSGENYVNYKDCFQWFVDLIEKYKLYPLMAGYDRYSAQYLIDDLTKYGFHCDDVFQGTNLTPVIRETDGIIKDGGFNFGNNQLLKSHLLNSALKQDTETQRVKLVKVGKRTRIDGTAALLDAMCVRQKYWSELEYQLRNEG